MRHSMKTYLVTVEMFRDGPTKFQAILNTYVDLSSDDDQACEEVERLAWDMGWYDAEDKDVLGDIELNDWEVKDITGVETNYSPGARERQAEEERAWRSKCERLKDQWMAHYNKMVKKGVEPSDVWGPIFQKKGGAQ